MYAKIRKDKTAGWTKREVPGSIWLPESEYRRYISCPPDKEAYIGTTKGIPTVKFRDKIPEGWVKDEGGLRPKTFEEIIANLPPEEVRELRNERQRFNRLQEYPPIGDQLDAIMKWLATETEFGIPAKLKSIACKCMSVKSKYPLEEEN